MILKGKFTNKIFGFKFVIGNYTIQLTKHALGLFNNKTFKSYDLKILR